MVQRSRLSAIPTDRGARVHGEWLHQLIMAVRVAEIGPRSATTLFPDVSSSTYLCCPTVVTRLIFTLWGTKTHLLSRHGN